MPDFDNQEQNPDFGNNIDDVIRQAKFEFLKTRFTVSERSFAIMVDPRVVDRVMAMIAKRDRSLQLKLNWLSDVAADIEGLPPLPEGVSPDEVLFLTVDRIEDQSSEGE